MMHALNTLALYVGWAALVVYFGTLLLAVIAIPFRLHAQRKRIEAITTALHAVTAATVLDLWADDQPAREQAAIDQVIRESGGTP